MNYFEVDAQTAAIRRRDFIKLGAGASVMMALDPLGASAQSTASRPISIDLHTHWVPEAYDKALAQLKRPTPASTNPLDFDLDKRRKWMDEHGVQMHVLTLSGGMPWQWVPPDVGAHLAQIINDAAVEAHTAFPDRFAAGIELSIHDPELALKELNRVAGKPGLRAVHLPNSIQGRLLVRTRIRAALGAMRGTRISASVSSVGWRSEHLCRPTKAGRPTIGFRRPEQFARLYI